jgi:hypothetical protein
MEIAFIVLMILGLLILVFGIGALTAWVLMLLWNGIVAGGMWPDGPEISFWAAWGMLILFNILFGSRVTFRGKN